MKTRYYILDGQTPVPCDLLTWAHWFERADRVVALTQQEDIQVSTVFLGLDHAFQEDAAPLLFETMVFYQGKSEGMDRYSTWVEAKAGHVEMVKQVFSRHYQQV